MKTVVLATLVAAVLSVGLLGGTLAYQAASSSDGPASSSTASTASTAAAAPAARAAASERVRHLRPIVRWAPCKPPARLQGKACVTEEVHTVVVPAPAAAPAPATTGTRPPATQTVSTGGEPAEHTEPAEHGSEHEGEHGDEGGREGGEGGGEHGDD
ncbi:MAG: hypothetical protein KDB43_11310 [Nocardioidaceae bacterium]|nr:hypothetical protein [Nocardioidaceae bacterium]